MNRLNPEQTLEDYKAYAGRFGIIQIFYFDSMGNMKVLEVEP